MKFSMAKMLAVMGFVSVVLAAAFAMPQVVGLIVLSTISLLFLPQFLWTGVIFTRGRKRAFFLGSILGGIPHFVIAVYYCSLLTMYQEWESLFESGDELIFVNVTHIVGMCVGFVGGLSGLFAHWFIVPNSNTEIQSAPHAVDAGLVEMKQNSEFEYEPKRETSAFHVSPK